MTRGQIDVAWIVSAIRKRWLFIVLATLMSFSMSLMYAFFIARKVYESSALLIPVQSSAQDVGGAAAALLSGKKNGNADVDLYQSLLTSRTVIGQLLYACRTSDENDSCADSSRIYSLMRVDVKNKMAVDGAIASIAKSVKVGSKESGVGGIIEIRFQAETPELAQTIGKLVLEIGQREISKVKMMRSEIILDKLLGAVNMSKVEWDSAASVVAKYNGENRSMMLPSQSMTLARMELEKSAKEQKYLLARKEYELQALEKMKAVPPMMVLDSANLVMKKVKPLRSLLALIGIFGGLGVSIALALAFETHIVSTEEG